MLVVFKMICKYSNILQTLRALIVDCKRSLFFYFEYQKIWDRIYKITEIIIFFCWEYNKPIYKLLGHIICWLLYTKSWLSIILFELSILLSYTRFNSVNKLSSIVILSSIKLHKYSVFHSKVYSYLNPMHCQCLSIYNYVVIVLLNVVDSKP